MILEEGIFGVGFLMPENGYWKIASKTFATYGEAHSAMKHFTEKYPDDWEWRIEIIRNGLWWHFVQDFAPTVWEAE